MLGRTEDDVDFSGDRGGDQKSWQPVGKSTRISFTQLMQASARWTAECKRIWGFETFSAMGCSDPHFALCNYGSVICAVDQSMNTHSYPELSHRCLIWRVGWYPIVRKRSKRWYYSTLSVSSQGDSEQIGDNFYLKGIISVLVDLGLFPYQKSLKSFVVCKSQLRKN